MTLLGAGVGCTLVEISIRTIGFAGFHRCSILVVEPHHDMDQVARANFEVGEFV
jgi:hypothetical protein